MLPTRHPVDKIDQFRIFGLQHVGDKGVLSDFRSWHPLSRHELLETIIAGPAKFQRSVQPLTNSFSGKLWRNSYGIRSHPGLVFRINNTMNRRQKAFGGVIAANSNTEVLDQLRRRSFGTPQKNDWCV